MITPDSGTSLLTAPSWAMSKLDDVLPTEFNCGSKFDYPPLVYVIDGVHYELPSHHYMERYRNFKEEGDSVCAHTMATLDIL